jgi:hypothetical protein
MCGVGTRQVSTRTRVWRAVRSREMFLELLNWISTGPPPLGPPLAMSTKRMGSLSNVYANVMQPFHRHGMSSSERATELDPE